MDSQLYTKMQKHSTQCKYSVNALCSKHGGCVQETTLCVCGSNLTVSCLVDDVAKHVLELGPGTRMAKVDIRSAYRHVQCTHAHLC